MIADEDLHRHAAENIARADALLFGRVTYEMMEAAWRRPATGREPDGWRVDGAVRPDDRRGQEVRRVEHAATGSIGTRSSCAAIWRRPSSSSSGSRARDCSSGGVTLPLALAELGLIDEYEFVVHPRLAGHGPTLFAGLSKLVDLKLVSRLEFGSGAVAMRYEPRK